MQLPTGASRLVFIFAHPAGHVSATRSLLSAILSEYGVAMIRHQLSLQTAFWRGET